MASATSKMTSWPQWPRKGLSEFFQSQYYTFSVNISSGFGLKLNYWINLCLTLQQLQCLPKKSKFKRNIIFESIFWKTIGGCNNRDQSWYRVPSQPHNIFYYLLTANQFWCSHSLSMKNFKFKPKTLSKLDIYICKINSRKLLGRI